MAFKLAEAYVQFSQRGVSAVTSGADKASSAFKRATGSVSALSAGVAALATGGAIRTLFGFVEAAAEAEKQTAKLEAVLKSTGGVSGQTVESLEAHASALQKVTAFEDDTIKGAQAVLLTFKKIGGETFPQATEAALDLATVFDTDLKSAAMMVGKALEDPTRGITALRRAGVSFTKDQQDVIKSLIETNEVAKAQALILGEIKSQVGGSAKAVGATTSGQIEQFRNAMGDLAEEIGGHLIPVLRQASETVKAWNFALGGQAAVNKAFGEQTAGLQKRFLEAKTAAEAEAIQKEYFAAKKQFKADGGTASTSNLFGSYAANARIAAMRANEEQQRKEFAGASKAAGFLGRVGGAIGGQALGPARALADTIGKSVERESAWLSKQFESSLRQERLLQNIYDRLAPSEQAAEYQ